MWGYGEFYIRRVIWRERRIGGERENDERSLRDYFDLSVILSLNVSC